MLQRCCDHNYLPKVVSVLEPKLKLKFFIDYPHDVILQKQIFTSPFHVFYWRLNKTIVSNVRKPYYSPVNKEHTGALLLTYWQHKDFLVILHHCHR